MFEAVKEVYKALKRDENSVEFLQEESKDIVDIFTSTIDNLKEINDNITKAKEMRSEVIIELTNQNKSLDDTLISNQKVINKINKIFED